MRNIMKTPPLSESKISFEQLRFNLKKKVKIVLEKLGEINKHEYKTLYEWAKEIDKIEKKNDIHRCMHYKIHKKAYEWAEKIKEIDNEF